MSIRYPRWIEVCGRRISIPEDVRYVTYMEERLPIDLPAYCRSETTITFPNDVDGSLIRLGAIRVGRMWMPTIFKTRPGHMDCRERGSIYTRNVSIFVHYTLRYCQRTGSKTRNITVDFRIADYFNQRILRREYLRWLRRNGITMRCIYSLPETTQRRLIMMFYVWYLSRKVQILFDRLLYFITNFFYGILFASQNVRGVVPRVELPPLGVVYIAWGLTTRTYASNYVYGQYCRCDQSGITDKCTNVVTPYRTLYRTP